MSGTEDMRSVLPESARFARVRWQHGGAPVRSEAPVMRPAVAALVFLALVARTGLVVAQTPPPPAVPPVASSAPPPPPSAPPPAAPRVVMRLEFKGVPGCSNEKRFRLQMDRLVRGWAPFAPDARWRLVVTVTRTDKGYAADAELSDASGDPPWKTSAFPSWNCQTVI